MGLQRAAFLFFQGKLIHGRQIHAARAVPCLRQRQQQQQARAGEVAMRRLIFWKNRKISFQKNGGTAFDRETATRQVKPARKKGGTALLFSEIGPSGQVSPTLFPFFFSKFPTNLIGIFVLFLVSVSRRLPTLTGSSAKRPTQTRLQAEEIKTFSRFTASKRESQLAIERRRLKADRP